MRAARLSGPAVFAVCAVVFVALALDVALGGPVSAFDQVASGWIRAHAQPGLTRFMALVSALHAPRAILAATAAVALLLLWRRDGRGLLLLIAVVPGGAALNALLKHVFERPRPDFDASGSGLGDFAFPSGHAANATLFYGLVALLVMRRAEGRASRVGVACAALALVLLVAASRLVLVAHYPSDVIAAIAEAVAWLALWVTVARLPLRR